MHIVNPVKVLIRLIRLKIMQEHVDKGVLPFLGLRFATITISSKKEYHMFITLIFSAFMSALRWVTKRYRDLILGQYH